MRVLVPPAVRRSRSRDRRLAEHARATSSSCSALAAERIDVVPLGLGALQAQRAAARARAARALRPRRAPRACSACRPSARTRTCCALIDALARIPAERRPLLVLPGYPTRTRPSCASARARLGVADDVRFLGWVSGAELEGLWALGRRVRVPVAVRGLRPAGARGDGARRAGRLLERLLAARGRGRRRAAVRPARPGARSPRRSSGCSTDAALRRAAARARPRARARCSPGSARARLTLAELRARAHRRRRGCRPRSSRARRLQRGVAATAARRCAANHARCSRAAPAALVHAHDRRGDRVGSARRRDEAVDALLDQLGRRVVLAGHDDARRAARGGLDDDHPVALAPRGQQHAQRAARARASIVLAATKPGASTTLAPSPCSRDRRRSTARARGRRRRRSPRSPAMRRAAAPSPRRPPARASRGSGARRTRTSGSARRSAAAAARSPVVLALEHRHARRAGPPRAGARRAAARSRTRAGARARRARCTASRRARRRGRGTRASRRGSTPRASRRPARSAASGRSDAGGQQREVGERGGVHDVVAAAVAQQVPEHAQPEHERRQDPPAPVRRVERHPRARRHARARRVDRRLLAASHWRSVR